MSGLAKVTGTFGSAGPHHDRNERDAPSATTETIGNAPTRSTNLECSTIGAVVDIQRLEATWALQQLRFTAFPAPGTRPEDIPRWEALTGELPDIRQEQPKALTVVESGTVEVAAAPMTLTLSINPLQTDVLLQATPRLSGDGGDRVPMAPAMAYLDSLVARWVAAGQAVNRIAFACTLRQEADSKAAAFALLPRYLPIELDPELSDDFSFQLNRPVESTALPGKRLNRVAQWTIQAIQTLQITFGGGGTTIVNRSDQPWALQVVLDASSPAAGVDLDQEQLESLFRELKEQALTVAEGGMR